MFAGERGHAHLNLRRELSKFIGLVRELRSLFQEYCHRCDKSEQALGKDSRIEEAGIQREAAPEIVVPTREEYEAMFVDELKRELLKERNVGEIRKTLSKDQLIDQLMELDSQGVYGCGARNGYRAMEEPKVLRRPKNFNLEAFLEKHRQVE